MNSEQQRADHGFFTGALVSCLSDHWGRDFDWSNPQLELALRPYRQAGFSPLWTRLPAGDFLPAGCPSDRGEHLGICAEIAIKGAIP